MLIVKRLSVSCQLSFKKDFAVKKKVLLLHPALIESTARKALYLSVLQQATTLSR